MYKKLLRKIFIQKFDKKIVKIILMRIWIFV